MLSSLDLDSRDLSVCGAQVTHVTLFCPFLLTSCLWNVCAHMIVIAIFHTPKCMMSRSFYSTPFSKRCFLCLCSLLNCHSVTSQLAWCCRSFDLDRTLCPPSLLLRPRVRLSPCDPIITEHRHTMWDNYHAQYSLIIDASKQFVRMHRAAHTPSCCQPLCLISISLYFNAQINSTRKRIGGSTASHRIIYPAGTLTQSTQLLSIREMLRRIYSWSRQRSSSTQSPYLSIMAGTQHSDCIVHGAFDKKLYFKFISLDL